MKGIQNQIGQRIKIKGKNKGSDYLTNKIEVRIVGIKIRNI